jgi:hypothetical protein
MTAFSLIPAIVLWRVERRKRLVPTDDGELDAFTIEALA